jgi:hypothetical protein
MKMLASVREGQSRTLVVRGEAGVGKTALLEYAVQSASDLRVARAVGVESEMELPYAALHQVCGPMLYDPATNRWTPTGSMNVGRISFTGTLLRDGRVLVVGGNSTSGGLQASAELYDPATGRWTLTGSLRTPRRSQTATLLTDGTVLVAGGANSTGWPRNAELYIPGTGRWRSAGTMTTGREGATATRLGNGRVLVAGGATRAHAPPPSSTTRPRAAGARPGA